MKFLQFRVWVVARPETVAQLMVLAWAVVELGAILESMKWLATLPETLVKCMFGSPQSL